MSLSYIKSHSQPHLSYEETDQFEFQGHEQEYASYVECRRKNIMFSQMMTNMKLQKDIMFTYKLPFFLPRNRLLENQEILLLQPNWMRNWSWVGHDQSVSLVEWSDSLADESFATINSFLSFQKASLVQYGQQMNLASNRYWMTQLNEPYEYIEHLKRYIDMLGKLYSTSRRAFDRTSLLLKKTQGDLAYAIEKILR